MNKTGRLRSRPVALSLGAGCAVVIVGMTVAGYLDTFLATAEIVIPGISMKNFELWDEERAALVAFLQSRR